MKLSRRAWITQQITEQRKWIEQCGGTLSGYVAHYGTPGEERCYGNGGHAIYAADMNALGELEQKLTRCR